MSEHAPYIVGLMGARMHYAVPRLLHRHGALARFYTDICSVKGWPQLLRLAPRDALTGGLRRLAGRRPIGVPKRLITSFTRFGLRYQKLRRDARSASELTAAHLWAGSEFCRLIVQSEPPEASSAFAFNSAGLELLREWRRRGRKTVLEQTIAPRRVEERLMREEQQAFPDWQESSSRDKYVHSMIEREEAEWREADLIICGSEFVREGIRECGGPVGRCCVVPYGVDLQDYATVAKQPLRDRALRVLTVGEVGLRKGSHYALQAARRMKNRAVFRMAGPMGLLPSRTAEVRAAIEYIGVIPRESIASHYAWADVFLLPSLCEGSATVVYEALSAGLPVITTMNAGSIVEDGKSGWIVQIRSADAIVERLELLRSRPDLLHEMSIAARERARLGAVEAYGARLLSALSLRPAGSVCEAQGTR